MELIDLFLSFPLPVKILLVLLVLEWLVTHFRRNACINSIYRIETLLDEILAETKGNKKEHIDEQQLLKLLIGATVRQKKENSNE